MPLNHSFRNDPRALRFVGFYLDAQRLTDLPLWYNPQSFT